MIVVTGATGNVGRPLTQVLAAAGHEVTAVSRRTADVPEGVRHLTADLAEPGSLEPAVAGAKALFLLVTGDLHAPGAEPGHLVRTAVKQGVRRIVLLSTQGTATRPSSPTRIAMRQLEDVVRNSGVDWTILRPSGFASNALWWAEPIRTKGLVAAPFGDVAQPLVDPADIAEVAAAALLDDQQAGSIYELTGPELISPREQTAVIAAALGSAVRFHDLSRAEAKVAMTAMMPPEVADDTLDVLGTPTPAELLISPDVQRVLGRAPRSFADWTARNLAAFR